MKSVCCLALLICHIELEFQKSTAVNLRNPLRSLWLSIGRAQPIGAWRQRKCRCGKSLYSSLFIIVIWNCGVFLSVEWLAGMRGEISLHTRQNALEFQPVLTVARRLLKVKGS